MRGPFIIEFRAEFSSIEGTINNHELTLGAHGPSGKVRRERKAKRQDQDLSIAGLLPQLRPFEVWSYSLDPTISAVDSSFWVFYVGI